MMDRASYKWLLRADFTICVVTVALACWVNAALECY